LIQIRNIPQKWPGIDLLGLISCLLPKNFPRPFFWEVNQSKSSMRKYLPRSPSVEKLKLEVVPDFWGNLITTTIGAMLFLLISPCEERAPAVSRGYGGCL
jgi:hypothetical protein